MRYVNAWRKGREETKIKKTESFRVLWTEIIASKKLNREEIEKLNKLICLYLETHDFVTNIGEEISKMADKAKK